MFIAGSRICGVSSFVDDIEGLLYAFYPGQEGGNALADVLFGDYNPAGILPQTLPQSDAQLPAWNDNFNDDYGSGYRWFDKQNLTPEYAFGFGLSYTSFACSNLQVQPDTATKGEPITVQVDVKNTGNRAGEEVVQIYLTNKGASMEMPEKALKAFDRIFLEPGETRIVSLTLPAERQVLNQEHSLCVFRLPMKQPLCFENFCGEDFPPSAPV